MKSILTLLLITLFHASAYAGIFKCTLGDQVTYQSAPCNDSDKQTTSESIDIPLQSENNGSESCDLTCSTAAMTCRSNLKFGNYNSDGGLEVCALLEKSCSAECNEADNANKLKQQYTKAKSAYTAKLKRIASNQQEIQKNKQLALKAAEKKEKARKACILKESAKIEKIYQPIDQLDGSQRRRYKSALEEVAENCWIRTFSKMTFMPYESC